MDVKKGLNWIVILSLLLVIVFSYLTSLHYSDEPGSFCDISTGVSCDIVNKSQYSEFMGIPVSIMGIITFLIIGGLAWKAKQSKKINIFGKKVLQKSILKLLLLGLIVSTVFALWLIYAELVLILSICLFCVVSDIIILVTFAILIELNKKNINSNLFNILRVFAITFGVIVLYLVYKIIVQL